MTARVTTLLAFFAILLTSAWVGPPQDPPPDEEPERCCKDAVIVQGGVIGSIQCSRTECLSHEGNPIADCGGLVTKDTVINAACQNCPEETTGTCDPEGMEEAHHMSSKINCDYEDCDSDGDGINDGSKCVVTPAPGEPPTEIPYNKCADSFTICPCT